VTAYCNRLRYRTGQEKDSYQNGAKAMPVGKLAPPLEADVTRRPICSQLYGKRVRGFAPLKKCSLKTDTKVVAGKKLVNLIRD
jgi:hypothetical protein